VTKKRAEREEGWFSVGHSMLKTLMQLLPSRRRSRVNLRLRRNEESREARLREGPPEVEGTFFRKGRFPPADAYQEDVKVK